jgi:hypothetical protein
MTGTIAVSTVLGRFVIPIYYVLGERLRGSGARSEGTGDASPPANGNGRDHHSAEASVIDQGLPTT